MRPVLLFYLIQESATTVVEGFSSSSQQQVKVRVERHLPSLSTPQGARQAWFDFVWEKGGGLPLLGVLPQQKREPTDNLETTIERRMLIPIGMEEQLIVPPHGDEDYASTNNSAHVKYQVTKGGLLSTEIVPDSHLGVVTFELDPQNGGTMMRWDVNFDTTEPSRTFVWQAVTERTITDTCDNFQASVATPDLYQRTTCLKSPGKTIAPEQAMDQWVQFCWKQGGGFPLPIPPIIVDDNRWIVPPFLKERLLSTETKGDMAEIQYQVENPSQFVYQVYTHRGRIQLTPRNDKDDNSLEMTWQIEIRPFPEPWASIVKAFTAAVVSSYARNFKWHVKEGEDAMVALKPPRGSGGSDNTLLQVRKDSWIGGVLDAHLRDQRSTTEQTLAIFQPWTWGRTSKDDEEGEDEQWTKGYLSSDGGL